MLGEDFLRLEDILRGAAETRQAIMQLSISVCSSAFFCLGSLLLLVWYGYCNTHDLEHNIDRLKLQDVTQGYKGASVCMVLIYTSCLVLLSEVHETDYAVYLFGCMHVTADQPQLWTELPAWMAG